jgi:tRNA(Ile)-lysidine synthase
MNTPEQINLPVKFRNFITEKNLIENGEKILLTVSGGMDSMVMANLFSQTGYSFAIAHCNFTMRGAESDREEETVRNFSNKLGVEFYVKRFDTVAYANEHKLSIQEAARNLRYEWFGELCSENGYEKIATAHHHNDSIETFFINLMRGSGPAGLRGIPVVNRNIIRPLLFTTREEISDYAKENQIPYRTDSSNETDDYLRNRIRHHLIPVLTSLTPDFEERFFDTFENISFLYNYSMEQVEKWKSENLITRDGMIHIPIDAITKQENPVQFLEFLLYSFGITGMECSKILQTRIAGKIFTGKNFELLRDRENLILNRAEKSFIEINVGKIPFGVIAGKKSISLWFDKSQKSLSRNDTFQQVDATKLTFPLKLRTWQQGDYFYPLGMTGRKKVSDFFIDKKLSLFEKENTILLLSGKDIVCILGHRIDDRFKVTGQTEKILNIELS